MGNSTTRVMSAVKPVQRPPGHIKARCASYPRNDAIKRFTVPDDRVAWSVQFPEYRPPDYTAPSVLSQPSWADPDFRKETSEVPKWNEIDGTISRKSHTGVYEVADGISRNPIGRTGLAGRGLLGRWGPNHAADPIVSRWKRDEKGNIIKDSKTGKPILQFIAIQRRDSGEWAIPGGMVDPGENISATLRREFEEEAMSSETASAKDREHIESVVSDFFVKGEEGMVSPGEMVSETLRREFGEEALNSLECSDEHVFRIRTQLEEIFCQGVEVYRGYVDDPRNTDNSWMETVAFNFHDESGDSVGRFKLHAGDDAVGVRWTDISSTLALYASHSDFIEKVIKQHQAHW